MIGEPLTHQQLLEKMLAGHRIVAISVNDAASRFPIGSVDFVGADMQYVTIKHWGTAFRVCANSPLFQYFAFEVINQSPMRDLANRRHLWGKTNDKFA